MEKYKVVIPWGSKATTRELHKDNERVATFYDISLCHKVCDLLNETSRSQGKYPKVKE